MIKDTPTTHTAEVIEDIPFPGDLPYNPKVTQKTKGRVYSPQVIEVKPFPKKIIADELRA